MKKEKLLECVTLAFNECFSGKETGNKNQLESWTGFIDRLDSIGRRHIGDALEASGKSRYTGKEIKNNE